jgi:acetate kinase
MGLTPTGGVMMGTRCGDLDPGVMLYLQRNGYRTPEALEELVDKQSGLLGVSGVSSDVRQLLSVRQENPQADLGLRMFCYQTRKAIAAMTAALGGLDLLVFAGGIGEHSEELRHEICTRLEFLWAQAENDTLVKVIPVREDEQICRIAARLACS